MHDTERGAGAAVATPVTERYSLRELIGRGGMGEVWRAWDHELDQEIALKSLRPSVARDTRILARFRREAKLARRIKHVNVAQMYDLIEIEGQKYLSMEYVDGKTLAGILSAKRNLPVHVALNLMRQICGGVHAAHEAGVVHRDLKPQNVMVTRRHGRISILDFGIAWEVNDDHLTEVGIILGSPQYLSYEQLSGRPVTAASDVYQLGILLYELVTGVSPFRAPGTGTAALRALREIPPDPRSHEPRLPSFVAEAIIRCLSKHAEDRFPSALALLDALDVTGAPQGTVARAGGAQVQDQVEVEGISITLGGMPTALVASSDTKERASIADRLRRLGCSVTDAPDGRSALQAAHEQEFSIIVLAARLPDVDGLTACQILKRLPQCADTGVLVVVESDDAGKAAFAREAGATDVVASPLNVHAFARTVREVLANRSARRLVDSSPSLRNDMAASDRA